MITVRFDEGVPIRVRNFLRSELGFLQANCDLVVGIVAPPPVGPTLADAIRWVSFETGVSVAMITGGVRSLGPVRCRDAVSWAARCLLGKTLQEIGRVLGGRDHATIRTAFARAEARRERDPAFRRLTDRLAAHIEEARS